MLFDFKSTLLNTIPVFGEAGLIFILTLDPVWIPMPLKETDFDKVFEKAYKCLNEISFEGIFYRKDIGHQVRIKKIAERTN